MPDALPDSASVAAELAALALPRFDETVALQLGALLVGYAQAEAMPVVINIRNGSRTFFHAALPGSSANNDSWARRKSNLALLMNRASLWVGRRYAEIGRTLADDGLAPADFADSGGAVPIVVANAGPVAVCTVSGLPQVDDHKLVLRGLRALLAQKS